MKKIVFIISILLSGCGNISSTIEDITKSTPSLVESQSRSTPDFIPGEIVTTSAGTAGYELKAVFGEVTEKKTLSNGWQIEGVFYE